MSPSHHKKNILNLIIKQLKIDISVAETAVEVARDTATHQDCLGSSKYETMGTEASYLAQGQGMRLLALERSLAYFKQLKLSPCSKITCSSLITLEDETHKQQTLWLAADAGGLKIQYHHMAVTVITTKSPLGRALLGKEQGDDVALRIAGTIHYYDILKVL